MCEITFAVGNLRSVIGGWRIVRPGEIGNGLSVRRPLKALYTVPARRQGDGIGAALDGINLGGVAAVREKRERFAVRRPLRRALGFSSRRDLALVAARRVEHADVRLPVPAIADRNIGEMPTV